QPCTGIMRHTADRPALQGLNQCILKRVLRQREISKPADERTQHPPMFLAERDLDVGGGHSACGASGGRCAKVITGLTSTEPYFAPGIFAAHASASSRSAHSST